MWSSGEDLGCPGTSLTRNPSLHGTQPGTQPQRFKKVAKIAGLLQKGGLKIGEKIQKLGQKILDFFQKIAPEVEK